MKALVLYHDNCPDGFTAAWSVWARLGEAADYRAVNHGQEPPLDAAVERRVILVDFSYPRAALDQLAHIAARVEVYDHHKTAEDALRGWADEAPETRRVVFDMTRSGAGIAWDEFNAPWWLGRPTLVNYVEDRDLWRWALPNSREISEYIFSVDRTFEDWNRAATDLHARFGSVVEMGAAMLRMKHIRVKTMCKNVRWVTLAGVRIPVINASWDFSEVGEYLHQNHPEAPCGGYYFDRDDKRQWGFRVVTGSFDVAALCQQYGGGGHRTAAGFTSALDWMP